jgi:hypothetical protein
VEASADVGRKVLGKLSKGHFPVTISVILVVHYRFHSSLPEQDERRRALQQFHSSLFGIRTQPQRPKATAGLRFCLSSLRTHSRLGSCTELSTCVAVVIGDPPNVDVTLDVVVIFMRVSEMNHVKKSKVTLSP